MFRMYQKLRIIDGIGNTIKMTITSFYSDEVYEIRFLLNNVKTIYKKDYYLQMNIRT